jgi:hypothetical protein
MEEHFKGFDGCFRIAREKVQRPVANVVDGGDPCLGHHGEQRV